MKLRKMNPVAPLVLILLAAVGAATPTFAQARITPPKIGEYTVGDDYFLANYTQLIEYWRKLERESDRLKLVEIGKTAEGRPMMMAIITSAENHKNLARYQDISRRLARAEGLTDEQARALAAEGKAVVWIDGGLHATETIPAQALFIEAYDLLSRNDPETLRILNDVILLLVPANPDGMDLVSDWYMRENDPKKRNLAIPRLYQKYVGHDNNRDSFVANQPETEAINRQMYIEWIPQIMYNQHQTGPAGSVLFFSPFRDPFNYNQDPLVPIGIDLVGAAVHQRFLAEGKPGSVLRSTAPYSTWFNGGTRTTTGFHNQIGLLAEIIGNPTPISIPLISSKLLPDGNQPAPIGPRQEWHQRQSIEYLLTSDRAILDIASKFREDFLYRIYRAGKNSIERGSRDHWTLTPKHIAAIEAAYAKDQAAGRPTDRPDAESAGDEGGGGRARGIPVKYLEQIQTPEARDPRGYVIPADQPDLPTAVRFVNALLKNGVDVHRATAAFTVAGKTYPAGSFVVKAAQAFRPHLRDMFEPQDHPNDLLYPGGPPKPPYDITGYTLAYQFGIRFDRILDGFDGPFEKIAGLVKAPAGTVGKGTVGYLLDHQPNDAYTATNRLLAAGEETYWLTASHSANGKTYPGGTIYIPAKATTRPILEKLAAELGVSFDAIEKKPQGDALKLRPVRVGLWDRYGGSMESGHIRWLFEQVFPTQFQLVFAQELDAGNLKEKFDVLIFPDGAIPERDSNRETRQPENLPAEFVPRVGTVTLAKTGPQLRKFVQDGGTILAIGRSTAIGGFLGLPLVNALTETTPDGGQRRLSSEKFFIPGSILRADIDTASPLTYGLSPKIDIFYRNSPVFRLLPDAGLKGVRPIAWFPGPDHLRSGWAWGQHHLTGTAGIIDAEIGAGRVVLFGPEITFRGQPHGTFKFLFNGIHLAGAKAVKLDEPSRGSTKR